MTIARSAASSPPPSSSTLSHIPLLAVAARTSPRIRHAKAPVDPPCPAHSIVSSGIRTLAEMDASSALSNVTSFLPSPADLLMVFPRLFSKASSLGDMIRSGGSVIAEPTLANVSNSTITTSSAQFVQASVAAVAEALEATSPEELTMFQALKNMASFFSYVTSKWAIATFAIVSRLHAYTAIHH